MSERLEKMARETAEAFLRGTLKKERVYVDPYYRGDGEMISGHWREIPRYSFNVDSPYTMAYHGGRALEQLGGEEIAEFHMAFNSPIQAMVVRRPDIPEEYDHEPVSYDVLEWDGEVWFPTGLADFSLPRDYVHSNNAPGLRVNGSQLHSEGSASLTGLYRQFDGTDTDIVEYHLMENAPIHATIHGADPRGRDRPDVRSDIFWDGDKWRTQTSYDIESSLAEAQEMQARREMAEDYIRESMPIGWPRPVRPGTDS